MSSHSLSIRASATLLTVRALGLRSVCVVMAIITVLAVHVSTAVAQEGPIMKLQREAKVDQVGDAHMRLEIKMSTGAYTREKANTPNVAVLLRRLGNGQHWAELEEVSGRFDDNTSTIVIEYMHRGFARPIHENLWEIRPEQNTQADLVGVFGNVAVFNSAEQTELGLVNMIVRLEAPPTSSDLTVSNGVGRITYRVETAGDEGDNPNAEFTLEAKPRIMSCLAKSCSNDAFASLWVARSVLKNTGDQTLSDFRVRFRVIGYSDWSRWMQAEKVVPGQTVVDAFFPVFDLDKLAKMDGNRPATLEVEYNYQRRDGRTIQETDSRRVELLARNQVVYSSLPDGEAVVWHDMYDYAPAILSSFVTSNDPVIQQLAGGISGLAGGPAASLKDEDAIAFLRTLYDYMGASGISYQTSPGLRVQGQFGQHVKYGRDVLRNRAGTCIDLAILYGSACQAVGLRPALYLVPGHCFPTVELRSGRIVPVEATKIGKMDFEAAVELAFEEVKEAHQSGDFYRVDIQQLKEMGVYSLDLPEVDPDFLDRLGYTFKPVGPQQVGPQQVGPQPVGPQPVGPQQVGPQPVGPQPVGPQPVGPQPVGPQPVSPQPVSPTAFFAGEWHASYVANGYPVQSVSLLNDDGRYGTVLRVTTWDGFVEEIEEYGTYQIRDNCMVLTSNGQSVSRPFRLHGNTMEVWLQEYDMSVVYQRVGWGVSG